MEKLRHTLLALATPKSGSRFLTKVLRNAGFKIGHESFKAEGTIGMFFAVEDCFYPGKHWTTDDQQRQRRSDYEFEQVWHFTRNPLKVIPSMASDQLPGGVWVWQERHTGISCGLYPKMLRAMRFWVAWNQFIENSDPDFFFRIEDIDQHWGDICDRLGIEGHPTVPKIPRDYGTAEKGPRRTVPTTWDEMKSIDNETYLRVREMAARYGYEE